MTRELIDSFFEQATRARVLVIGDLMLDRYIWGRVERISPEAPVPVVDVYDEESRPGGAANVALNIASFGATPVLCGAIGNDRAGDDLLDHLQKSSFDTSLVFRDSGRTTTSKIRIIGNNQQVLRVDREDRFHLETQLREKVLEQVKKALNQVDAVIFEDYDKGLLDEFLIQKITQAAKSLKKPVIVDPKFRNFLQFGGTTLFKPNLKELNEALGLKLINNDQEGIREAVSRLRYRMPHENTVITLSEKGMIAFGPDLQPVYHPAHLRKIRDVSGAGDSVVSVLALATTCGLDLAAATWLANLAGGLVCEEVGVVPVNLPKLREEANLSLANQG
ncbi:MAG: D-glycero-beta-D-manno-heptose-7-phosphate kinase [Bacteroidia bacterium]|nr:D-glycero-beta-D-manno-heptose-7-phosphate kinase [Bacteroidia bacterium]